MSDVPRRNKIYEWVPAEKAIYDAIQEIEKMPPDLKLTEAIILLNSAKDIISDYIDRS